MKVHIQTNIPLSLALKLEAEEIKNKESKSKTIEKLLAFALAHTQNAQRLLEEQNNNQNQ